MACYLRGDRAAVRFGGRDAQKLLNDVITGHVVADAGPARWWALLSPQGKVQAEGLVGWAEDAFWLDVPAEAADAFLKKMKLYKLRAEVTIEDLRESHRVGWSPDGAGPGVVHADGRRAGLGYRVIAPAASTEAWIADDREPARVRIAAGIPEQGQDFAADTAFAHDIGMDFLDGIDFSKGCYVGQEVVSRMKHRGTARRRPVIVSGVEGAGGVLLAEGRESGTVGRAVDGRAVGIVRLDRIADPEAARVGDRPVRLALPEWAGYAFGEAAGEE